jgi:preprotein translocase subunit SecD
MNRDWVKWGRAIIVAAVAVLCVVALLSTQPILGLDLRGGVRLVLEGDQNALNDYKKNNPGENDSSVASKIAGTIAFRVNASGLTEATVTENGPGRVLVEIPCPASGSCADPGQLANLIERQGYLEFKKVIQSGGTDNTFSPTPDQEVVHDKGGTSYLVLTNPLITGAAVTGASVLTGGQVNDPSSPYVVQLKFSDDGAKRFAEVLTNGTLKGGQAHNDQLGDRMAIILDGVVQSAPVIDKSLVDAVRGANGWRQIQNTTTISGQPSLQEGTNLAIVLRSGNLPVPVHAIEQETIGPSLGQDSINAGMMSVAIAGIIILIFMLFYYRWSGLIADFNLLFNLLILVAALILLKATLTLPGIAGIVLTVGMGVDSNVLIFERVREEWRSGKVPGAALDAGYDRALLTVIDSHVTTLITALILFTFGTGPIKGFAITLSLGIFINLFSALIGTKLAFELIKEREPKRLSI